MKVAGFLLLPAGWILVLAAIALLTAPGARGAFLPSPGATQGLRRPHPTGREHQGALRLGRPTNKNG